MGGIELEESQWKHIIKECDSNGDGMVKIGDHSLKILFFSDFTVRVLGYADQEIGLIVIRRSLINSRINERFLNFLRCWKLIIRFLLRVLIENLVANSPIRDFVPSEIITLNNAFVLKVFVDVPELNLAASVTKFIGVASAIVELCRVVFQASLAICGLFLLSLARVAQQNVPRPAFVQNR